MDLFVSNNQNVCIIISEVKLHPAVISEQYILDMCLGSVESQTFSRPVYDSFSV